MKIINAYIITILFLPFLLGKVTDDTNIGQIVISSFDCLPWVFLILNLSVINHYKRDLAYVFIILVCFLISALLQGGGSILFSIRSFLSLFRFFPLYLFVRHYSDEKILHSFQKTYYILFWVLSLITISEILGGFAVSNFFAPIVLNTYSTVTRNALEQEEITCVFFNSVDIGYSLWLLYLFYIFNSQSHKTFLICSLVLFFQLFFIRSVTVNVLALLSFSLYLYKYFRKTLLLALAIAIPILIYIILTNLDYLSWLLRYDIYQSRGGFLFVFFPQFLVSKEALFGVSPNPELVILLNKSIRSIIVYQDDPIHFCILLDDIFFIALFIYYGIVGALTVFGGLFIIFKRLMKLNSFSPRRRALIICIVFGFIFGLFANQVFSIRPLTVFLWPLLGVLSIKPTTNEAAEPIP